MLFIKETENYEEEVYYICRAIGRYHLHWPCTRRTMDLSTKTGEKNMKNLSEIYFAGGCFWGTDHFLKQIRGVKSTQVGYANGNIANPTYQQVCTGKTNFAETVKVEYNPQEVPLKLLIDLF